MQNNDVGQVVNQPQNVSTTQVVQQPNVVNTTTQPVQPNQNVQVPGTVQTQAVFTQEQVNGIVQSRVSSFNTKVSDLEAKVAELEGLQSESVKQITGYQQRDAIVGAGVKPEFIDFVTFEANKLVTEDKPFNNALVEYLNSAGGVYLSPGVIDGGVSGSGTSTSQQNLGGEVVQGNSQVQPVNGQVQTGFSPVQTPQQGQVQQMQVANTSFTPQVQLDGVGGVDAQVSSFLQGKGIRI